MFADHQFLAFIAGLLKDRRLRADFGLLSVPDDYETIRAQPASPHPLPMTPGRPDTVFADDEDGVVAIKHGEEIAVVHEAVEFTASGEVWKRPNWTNFGFANGGQRYPGKLESARVGEALPIAKFPGDVPFQPGKELPFAGRAEFYQLRFGHFLIAMNTTKDQTFEVTPPPGLKASLDLVSKQPVSLDAPLKVGPRSTVVLLINAP